MHVAENADIEMLSNNGGIVSDLLVSDEMREMTEFGLDLNLTFLDLQHHQDLTIGSCRDRDSDPPISNHGGATSALDRLADRSA